MNKDEFVKRLKDSLDIFEESTIDKEIAKYTQIYESNRKEGFSEEESIQKLGSISDIQKKIYKEHGINPQKINKKNSLIYKQFEELFQVIHHLIDEMSKNDFQGNLKIIIDLVILFAFICLIKIPFILVRNLGDGLIVYLDMPILSDIWGIIIDIIYIIVAIIVFINIFNKYFKNLKARKKTKIKTKELESINLEENE